MHNKLKITEDKLTHYENILLANKYFEGIDTSATKMNLYQIKGKRIKKIGADKNSLWSSVIFKQNL